MPVGTYNFLDLVPMGRHEAERPMARVRHHERHGDEDTA
jgi:hypothetical protein